MTHLSDIRADLMMTRDPECDVCGRWLLWQELELHHIFGRDEGNTTMDDAAVLVFVCRRCHHPGSLGHEIQTNLVLLQRDRGYDLVAWREKLDWKIKPRFPWEATCATKLHSSQ